jgi:hypothetical protein
MYYLPRYGCFSTGLIYAAIGVIALLSFFKLKQGGADESSLLVFLQQFLVGKIFIWIILLGIVSFVIWRVYESFKDPYDYGSSLKGIALRTGIALSTIPDIMIGYSAISVMVGNSGFLENGVPVEQRHLTGAVLRESWGPSAVILLGAIVCLAAIVQFVYGIIKGYRERLDIDQLSPTKRKLIYATALAGYSGRGIILGIMGFFLIKAGIENNAQQVVNTDKAFDFIGDHVGHVYFILVSLATICYGVFMFIMGSTYDPDKD